MSKQNKTRKLQSPPSTQRGRTARTNPAGDSPDMSVRGALNLEKRIDSNRPTGSGGGKNRGDRRDTSPTYTTNVRHAARGSNPRADVKTRKR